MSPDMIFTSESVTPSHPDKLCDQISDAAIDAFLREDAGARAVVECALATGVVFLAARFAADARVDLSTLARKVILDAGYCAEGFDARSCSILTSSAELPLEAREPPPDALDEEAIARRVMRGSPGAKMALIHRANSRGRAARRFPARTLRVWSGPAPTPPAMLQRTSSRRDSRTDAKSISPMSSARRSR